MRDSFEKLKFFEKSQVEIALKSIFIQINL